MYIKSVFVIFSEETDNKGNADAAGKYIRNGLRGLNHRQTKQRHTDQKNRDGNCTGADDGENGRDCRFLNALIEHIHRYRKGHKDHADGVIAQCRDSDFDNLR